MTTTTNTSRNAIHRSRPLLSLAAVTFTACAAHAQCDPAWGPVGSGADSDVYTFQVFDDGSGEALYMGGHFQVASGVSAGRIAKWDGETWSPVGNGFAGRVFALAVFDDGTGERLYASPRTSASASQLQRWNGTSWSELGNGLAGHVYGMQAFDDGSGPALYVVGNMRSAGGVSVNNIARWDGQSWSAFTIGMLNGRFDGAFCLTVFDDGTGPALYAGGDFGTAGGVPANSIARWDGTTWSPVGAGVLGGSYGVVYTMEVADDGTGPKLYAGGDFTIAGGVSANHIAVWDGKAWAPMGDGLDHEVRDIVAFDDGSGPAIYAAGGFSSSGATAVRGVARWDGVSWQPVDMSVNGSGWGLSEFDAGSGPQLYLGGIFSQAGIAAADNVARLSIPVPSVTTQPPDTNAMVGDSASFRVAATSTIGPYSVRWRKDGQPLFDQPRIAGTGTTKLTINPVEIADAGLYDAILTNACGTSTTRAAQLSVTYKFCYADCDQSTGPRVLDIFDFLCFQSAFVSFDPYADCDDNNVLDIFDFLCFQNAFVSGCL